MATLIEQAQALTEACARLNKQDDELIVWALRWLRIRLVDEYSESPALQPNLDQIDELLARKFGEVNDQVEGLSGATMVRIMESNIAVEQLHDRLRGRDLNGRAA